MNVQGLLKDLQQAGLIIQGEMYVYERLRGATKPWDEIKRLLCGDHAAPVAFLHDSSRDPTPHQQGGRLDVVLQQHGFTPVQRTIFLSHVVPIQRIDRAGRRPEKTSEAIASSVPYVGLCVGLLAGAALAVAIGHFMHLAG